MTFPLALAKPDMSEAWHEAATTMGLHAQDDVDLHHGVGGRTVSGLVVHPDEGRAWEGNPAAERLLPPHIPRPRLLAEHTWGKGPVFQALLFSFVQAHPVSATPDLRAPLPHGLNPAWWAELRTALHQLGQVPVPERRRSHTPGFLERIPTHLPEVGEVGVNLEVETWVTSHADLHWANLTLDPLVLMDWEGWGAAPLGYDAAVLHAYALAEPPAAAKVREVFADVLDTEEGRLAHLIICAEIVQAGERDPLHERLAPYARAFVHDLLAKCTTCRT